MWGAPCTAHAHRAGVVGGTLWGSGVTACTARHYPSRWDGGARRQTLVASGTSRSSGSGEAIAVREADDVAGPAAHAAHSNGAAAPPDASGGAPSPPAATADAANTAAAAAPASSADPQQSGDAKQPAARWSPRDLTTGQSLALGGSVAAALLLTVFRREIAPAFKWIITQANALTDKSVIGEANPESLATLAAVLLSIYWSLNEFKASSERMKAMEGIEEQAAARLEELAQRLEATERRLEAAEEEVRQLRGELHKRRWD